MIYRVVIDTNILISAVFRDRTPELVLHAVRDGKAIYLTSPDIAGEVKRVLAYPKFKKYYLEIGRTPDEVYAEYLQRTEMVTPVNDLAPSELRDPKDMIILACALGGKADYIISGDLDLITLEVYAGIPVTTPAQFLAILNQQSDSSPE